MSARRAVRAGAVSAVAVAVTAVGLGVPSAGADEQCRLVRLPTSAGSPWGTVMDIELVDGEPVYYGSYEHVAGDGSRSQRAVVWHGLDGQPVEVGPGGDHDVAYDLTAGGLVNGAAWDPAAGVERHWVRDLHTGELHWVDTAQGPAEARDVWARRLNEAGAVAGAGARGKGPARAGDALAWDHYRGEPRVLPARGRGAVAPALDDRGVRAGHVEHHHLQGDGRWTVVDPTVWYPDGTVRTAARAGLDASVLAVDEAGRMAGVTWWGSDPAAGHFEAAFWPSVDRVTGLGVLPGGRWSAVFGMDDAGSVVGRMELYAPDGPHTAPWGTTEHNFLWQGEQAAVRVLPSLHAVATGVTDWRGWHSTHAAHAVHTGLDQVGAGTHAGYADGEPVGAPTVFVSASRCGQLVATTHEPRQGQDLATAQAHLRGGEGRRR